ncbi:MAG: DUF2225 domain-containing protein, partial [Bacillota bacterium]
EERSLRATAYEPTSLMVFTPDNLHTVLQKRAILNQNIISSLCGRIQRLQQPTSELPEMTTESTTEETTERETTDKTKTEEKTEQVTNSDPEILDFYLEGHQNYPNITANDFSKYLYQKSISCPVCSKKTEFKKVRKSRLRLQDVRDDLRAIYKKFKPEWYKIWSCPHCSYLARKTDFFDFNHRQLKYIKNQFPTELEDSLLADYQFSFSEPRRLDEVFKAYYLTIKLYNQIDASKDKLAYLWLRLNWIYEDVGAEELSNQASLRALNHLEKFYFKGSAPNLARSQTDKLTLLLALLLDKHGRKEKALPLLDDLIRSHQTNPRQKQLARDKFIAIRRKLKK